MNSYGFSIYLHMKLIFYNYGGVGGILGLGIRSVEIKRNTYCAGDLIDRN